MSAHATSPYGTSTASPTSEMYFGQYDITFRDSVNSTIALALKVGLDLGRKRRGTVTRSDPSGVCCTCSGHLTHMSRISVRTRSAEAEMTSKY